MNDTDIKTNETDDRSPTGEEQKEVCGASPEDKPGRLSATLKSVRCAAGKTADWSSARLDPKRHDGLYAVRYMERLVEWIRSAMASTPADTILDRLVHYGNLAALASMVLALAYGVLGAVRHVVFAPLPRAAAFVLLLAAFQYAANKFLKAGDDLMASTPSRLASPAFLNVVALLHTVISVVLLLGGLLLAVQQRNAGLFAIGLLLALVAYGVAFISLYPDRINVSVAPEAGAGEEALGILSFSIKVVVRLIPIVYGAGMIVGMLAMLGACFSRLGSLGYSEMGRQGSMILLATAAFPFAGYLFFAFYQLGLDVLRAILILPSKISGRQ